MNSSNEINFKAIIDTPIFPYYKYLSCDKQH